MSGLPRISGRECVRALEHIGFKVVRRKGSHIVLVRESPAAQIVEPDHRELDSGTLRAIIRHSGLGVDEFKALMG
ncbi:MAG TPA: type II toxin-antitoxin system HicA family toxin [Armatimonadota bacterium]|jgi:predicted RNA binding protein YcfA (HicA-like mRNA interferase family)